MLKTSLNLHRLIPIALTIWGLIGLYTPLRHIFVEYPQLPELFKQSDYDTSLYREWLFKTFFMSVESLITSAYGLSIMVKPSHLIKNIHLILAVIIGIASFLVRSNIEISPELTNQIEIFLQNR